MRTVKNVFRRKLRAFLTIFGITIGVFALVVMGSMAEKITLLADITLTLSEDQGASFGVPDLVIGSDLRGADLESFKVGYSDGRELTADDAGKAVVGSDMVRKMNANVGNIITVRGREFEVVGVLEKTFTIPDNSVSIPFSDAQDIFYDDLPDLVKSHLDPGQIASGITIYPDPGVDPDQLAGQITEKLPGYEAVGPAKFEEQVTSTTRIFTTIVFGVALISLLVGGLSVINTMTMSILERTREVGIRKALGASDGRIIRQFLGESAFIGTVGGLSGLLLGWLFVVVANAAGESSGTQIFLLTGRLAVGSVVFAVALGVLSGLYPSWHAARMNPVKALRYE